MALLIKFLALLLLLLPAYNAKAQSTNKQQVLEASIENNLQGRNRKDYLVYDYGRLEDAKLKALQLNDTTIMYNIGCMYRDGINVKRDYKQAKEWFSKAVQYGDVLSKVELAKIYSYSKEDTGMKQDLEKSEELLNEAIETDNPEVYYKLGQMYERGVFFEKNPQQAITLYKKAAEKNLDKAYVKLYLAYQFGKGVPRNNTQAVNWLRILQKLAKDQNVRDYATYLLSEKYYEMAIRLPKEQVEAKYLLFNLSWENGKAEAADMIAECHAKGYGVKRDCDLAKKWYEMSIRQFESTTAMEQLGNMLINADCGNYKRDYPGAAKLFQQAAELGSSYGAYMTGYMMQNGMGIPQNAAVADTWFKRSNMLKNKPKIKKIKRRKFAPEEMVR